MCYSLWYNRQTTSWVNYTTSCNTQSSAPEDGKNNCPKHVELTGIINKPLLLHLVGFLYSLFFIILLRLAEQSQFIPVQNVVYFITLPFLLRKIFTFYINDVLLFKCQVPGPKRLTCGRWTQDLFLRARKGFKLKMLNLQVYFHIYKRMFSK